MAILKQTSEAVASVKKNAPKKVKKSKGRYINPLTDFGFKLIFGTKEYLIDFLNAVLGIVDGIVDLHYDNTERPGLSEDDRTTIFDLYCTLGNGKHILIEMQYHPYEHFKERTIYYASRMIQEQGEGKKGSEDWHYNFDSVYSVNIVNFNLEYESRSDADATFDTIKTQKLPYASYIELRDRDTHQLFCDKLLLVFLELPYFTKKEHEVRDSIEWWMYILRNMATLKEIPDALRNTFFESLFLKAEIAKLSKADRKKYNQSLKNVNDMNIVLADRERKISSLQNQNSSLQNQNSSLQNQNSSLQNQNSSLQREVEELRRQLGLPATTAGRKPSLAKQTG